ncbi:MAG: phosphatase PAP2 family protein [Devosia sp.]
MNALLTRAFRARHFPFYLALAGIALLVGGFGVIAEEMGEGETLPFDNAILAFFRDPADPTHSIGPQWLREAGRDITALGGVAVLTIIVVLATLAFALTGKRLRAAFLAVSVIGGVTLSNVLKQMFNRSRPEFVDPDVLMSASFPSGHSALSAIVYLTLGVILAGSTQSLPLRVLVLVSAVLLTLTVGISRIYLGAHYPTDVAAGWAIGTAWALLSLVVLRLLESLLNRPAEA